MFTLLCEINKMNEEGFMNHYLIAKGKGITSILVELTEEFTNSIL